MPNTSRPWNLASNPPEGAPNSVQVRGCCREKGSVVWDRLPSEAADPVTVWMEKDGATRAVKVKYEDVKRLNESLAQLGARRQGKALGKELEISECDASQKVYDHYPRKPCRSAKEPSKCAR